MIDCIQINRLTVYIEESNEYIVCNVIYNHESYISRHNKLKITNFFGVNDS